MTLSTLTPWRSKERQAAGGLDRSPFESVRSEMLGVFDRFLTDFQRSAIDGFTESGTPRVELKEDDRTVRLQFDLPGVDPKEIDVRLERNCLTVHGARSERNRRDGESVVYSECRYGSFSRTVALPAAVDEDSVSAEFRNGVLTVELKKSVRAEGKKISVATGE